MFQRVLVVVTQLYGLGLDYQKCHNLVIDNLGGVFPCNIFMTFYHKKRYSDDPNSGLRKSSWEYQKTKQFSVHYDNGILSHLLHLSIWIYSKSIVWDSSCNISLFMRMYIQNTFQTPYTGLVYAYFWILGLDIKPLCPVIKWLSI